MKQSKTFLGWLLLGLVLTLSFASCSKEDATKENSSSKGVVVGSKTLYVLKINREAYEVADYEVEFVTMDADEKNPVSIVEKVVIGDDEWEKLTIDGVEYECAYWNCDIDVNELPSFLKVTPSCTLKEANPSKDSYTILLDYAISTVAKEDKEHSDPAFILLFKNEKPSKIKGSELKSELGHQLMRNEVVQKISKNSDSSDIILSQKEVLSAKTVYGLILSKDAYDVADYFVTFTTKEGEVSKEEVVINDDEWETLTIDGVEYKCALWGSQNYELSTLPAMIEATPSYVLKSDPPQKENYDILVGHTIVSIPVYAPEYPSPLFFFKYIYETSNDLSLGDLGANLGAKMEQSKALSKISINGNKSDIIVE
ncbi:MAG: hypothetical protein ACRCZY_08935 [Phocaeicola sp.]